MQAAAYSPDGRVVLTGSADRTARLWEATTGRPRGEPMPHDGPVMALAFSPDSRIVLTGTMALGTDTGYARLWDLETARPLGPPLRQPSGLSEVAFSRDGRAFLTAGPSSARFWNTMTLRPLEGLGEQGDGLRLVAAFSPDGLTAVTDTRQTADSGSGQRPDRGEWRHDETSWRAAFSPDGRTLLLASPDRSARLWDVGTGRSKGMPLPHPGPSATGAHYESTGTLSMAFSPDSHAVASGCTDRAARLWDVATGMRLGPALAQHEDVAAVQFEPGGRLLAVGGHDGLVRFVGVARAGRRESRAGAALGRVAHLGRTRSRRRDPDAGPRGHTGPPRAAGQTRLDAPLRRFIGAHRCPRPSHAFLWFIC